MFGVWKEQATLIAIIVRFSLLLATTSAPTAGSASRCKPLTRDFFSFVRGSGASLGRKFGDAMAAEKHLCSI